MRWKCRCSCGTERSVSDYNLRRRVTQSCGCYMREVNAAKSSKAGADWAGKRFGKLVIVKKSQSRSIKGFLWEAKCDCGNIKLIRPDILARGAVKSCGCTRKSYWQLA